MPRYSLPPLCGGLQTSRVVQSDYEARKLTQVLIPNTCLETTHVLRFSSQNPRQVYRKGARTASSASRSCSGTPPSGTGAHVQQRVPLNPIIHGPFRGSFHLVERAFPTPMYFQTSRLMTSTWRGPPCWSRTWRPPSTKTPSFMWIELKSSREDNSANRTAPEYGPRRSPRWSVEKSRVFPLPAAVLLLA